MFDSHPLLHMSTSQMWCLKDIIYVLLPIISVEDCSSAMEGNSSRPAFHLWRCIFYADFQDQAVQHISEESDGESHNRSAHHAGGDERKESDPDLQCGREHDVAEGQNHIEGDQKAAHAEVRYFAQVVELASEIQREIC